METERYNMPAEIYTWEDNNLEGFFELLEKTGAVIDRSKIIQAKGLFASEKFGFGGRGYSLDVGAITIREGLRMPYCGVEGIIHYLRRNKLKVTTRMAFHNPTNTNDYFFLFLTNDDRRVVRNIDLGSWE